MTLECALNWFVIYASKKIPAMMKHLQGQPHHLAVNIFKLKQF